MSSITAPAVQASALRRFWLRIRVSTAWMVGIAFCLRLFCILAMHTYKFRISDQNFSFGWEMGRIAASIASGHGFSNPFYDPTGPTAWEPPLTPFLIAGVFKLFGIYSHASSFVLLTINSLWSALTCIAVFRIARPSFGEKVAVGSAWTWALFPYAIYWDIKWVWETSLSALLVAAICWVALSLEDDLSSPKPWLRFGALWGIAALNSPSLLSFLPVSWLYAWYRCRRAGKNSLSGLLVAALTFCVFVTPWLVRNYRVFGRPVFLRANFGAELRMGNGPYADGTWQYYLHPTHNDWEFRKYQAMGELAYVAQRKKEAVDWIKTHPAQFATVTFRKFVYYWYGVPRDLNPPWLAPLKNSLFATSSLLTFFGLWLAIRQRRRHAWLFFWLLLIYPLIYYVVFPHARYRHPVDPEITILCVYVLNQAKLKKPLIERQLRLSAYKKR
jgi:4-amino-4-deoxy-L-arabinose transferase-like glycosyltransferase